MDTIKRLEQNENNFYNIEIDRNDPTDLVYLEIMNMLTQKINKRAELVQLHV